MNQLSVQEFARRVKEKHPAYSDMEDEELVQRVLLKYPEYRKVVPGGFSYSKALGIDIPGLRSAAPKPWLVTAEDEQKRLSPELSELISQSLPTGAPPPFAPPATEPPKGIVQRILDDEAREQEGVQVQAAGMAGPRQAPISVGQILDPATPAPAQVIEQAVPQEADSRFKAFFREAVSQPLAEAMKGYYQGSASLFDMFDQLARTLERKTGIKRGGLFEDFAKFYIQKADEWEEEGIPPEQGFASDLAAALYNAPGRLATDLPFIFALGQWGLPIWMGVRGAAQAESEGENVLGGAIKGAVKGTLLRGALKGASYLPKPEGLAAGGAIFGGMAAAEGEDLPGVVAQTLLGIGLTAPGRGMPRKQAAENIRTGLGLERAAELKLTKGEIDALRKVYNQPEYAKKTDIEFIQGLTREQTTEIFRNEKIPVPVRSKIRAAWNRATGRPVHEGLEVLGKPEEIYIEKAPHTEGVRALPRPAGEGRGQKEGVEYPVEYVGTEKPPLKGTVEYPAETKALAEVKPKPPPKKQPEINLGTVAKGYAEAPRPTDSVFEREWMYTVLMGQ